MTLLLEEPAAGLGGSEILESRVLLLSVLLLTRFSTLGEGAACDRPRASSKTGLNILDRQVGSCKIAEFGPWL